MTHPAARAYVFPDGAVMLAVPWVAHTTPDFIARLKAAIPQRGRRYIAASKRWLVYAPYAAQALALLRETFPDARVVEVAEAARAAGVSLPRPEGTREPLAGARHFAALHLLPSAPKEVVNAAYLALAEAYRPEALAALPAPERDRAHRALLEINGAIEALRAAGRA